MSIFQFPKHIVDELPRLLPYLEGYTSDITSPSYTPTSSNFKIHPQCLEHIPEELLYLVPYFEQVDQDLLWLLPYSKDFTTEDSSPSHIPVPSTHQRHDHVQYDSSDSEEDNSFADDSSDDSDSCSDSEDEFYECNAFEIDLGSNTNGHFDRYRLGDDDTDSGMTDPESSLDKNDEVHAAIVSESEEDDAPFAAGPMRASSAPTPARTVETVQVEQGRRIAPLPRRSITPPQSTATLYLFPTARTTRKNYAELEESDDENASDDEFVPEKSSGSGKRKNKSTSRGRRMKTSFDSGSSSGSSSPSPAPTTSSYGSPAPSSYGSPAPSSYDSPSPSNSSSSSSAASSSSRSSAKSKSKPKPKPKSSGRKSKSGRATKRASAVKKAAAPKKKQPRINTPRSRRTQVDYDLANDYEVHHDPVVWDENGEAPCVLCDLVLKAGRKADNKRHYRTHCKQFCIAQQTGQRIWVCSEEVDQVLDSYPEYRLPGYSHWGCKGSFCRKDTMVRHIKNGTCAR